MDAILTEDEVQSMTKPWPTELTLLLLKIARTHNAHHVAALAELC